MELVSVAIDGPWSDVARTLIRAMSEPLRSRIADAIYSLATGPGATFEAVSEQPDLMTLECVVADATGDGRSAASGDEVASVVIRFLEEAADSLTQEPGSTMVPNPAKAARAALGLKPELLGKPYQAVKGRKGRQQVIAEWLDVARESVENPRQDGTSPLSDVLGPVSQHLTRREVDYRVEVRRRAQRARRAPLESAMRVEWLGRFELYFKIWAPLGGLRHDLGMSLHHRRRDERDDAGWFANKALYYYAVFLVELQQFVARQGGLWVLPDTRTEDAIADTMWFIRRPIPLTEVDESTLRISFSRTPEMAPFLHEALKQDDLVPIVASWTDWVGSCSCKRLTHPRKDCRVHATIAWARFYMDALEAQWDFLADWYDLPRPGTTVDPLDYARRGRVVFPPPLPVDNKSQKE